MTKTENLTKMHKNALREEKSSGMVTKDWYRMVLAITVAWTGQDKLIAIFPSTSLTLCVYMCIQDIPFLQTDQ